MRQRIPRSAEEVAIGLEELEKKGGATKKAFIGGMDYLSMFGTGLCGLYTCRSDKEVGAEKV